MAEGEENRRGPPPNFAFEYRHVLHVAPQSQYSTEDEHKAAVIAKYKVLDEKAARDAPSPTPTPAAPPDKALLDRIAELEAALAKKEEAPRAPAPETPASTGKGQCPQCGKTFKRLDMHVCQEQPAAAAGQGDGP